MISTYICTTGLAFSVGTVVIYGYFLKSFTSVLHILER